jgi:hypothetical protein
MSGDGKRSVAEWPKLPRPSSTLPNRTCRGGLTMSGIRVPAQGACVAVRLGFGFEFLAGRDRGSCLVSLRSAAAGARVLKQNRGNGGEGVWKIQFASEPAQGATTVRVLHAPRGSVTQDMPLGDFMNRVRNLFRERGLYHRSPIPDPAARRHDPLLPWSRTRSSASDISSSRR